MSEIITDNLTGKASAGNVTITSEGGSATMQLQQGLVKTWVNFNGSGTISTRDTFNVSSMDDNGTGNYDINFSNNMNNGNYAMSGACYNRTVGMSDNEFYTTYARIKVIAAEGNTYFSDAGTISAMFTGDLA